MLEKQSWRGCLARIDWLLAAIVVLGLGLRLWGIGFGLPYMYHPDEGVPVSIALRMLHTGNLHPDFFDWPSLTLYLNALLYLLYFVLGRVMGWFVTPTDLPFPDVETIAVGKALMPEEFLLSRGLTAVFGAVAIIAIYLVCRQVSGSRIAGWLGALLLAVEPVSIRHSQFIRPDIPLVTFLLFSFLFTLRIVDDPRLRNYALAGIFAGLATSCKYNAALIVIPIAVAHFARFRARGFLRREIYIAAVASLAAFFLTTPYALLDWTRFWQTGILGDLAHYASGHAGGEGDTLQWYVSFLWSTHGWVLVLALIEALWIIVRRDGKGIVLLSFPLCYFAFVSLYTVRFESTILPVIPFVIVLATVLIVHLFESIFQRWKLGRVPSAMAFVGMAVLLALSPLREAMAYDAQILQPDARERAREWIDSNLPPGARIVIEPYGPYIERTRFAVEGVGTIVANPPDWYIQNGFEYLVFSYGTYGRFFENPARYPDFVNRYNAFFYRLTEVRRFAENGPEIRIYTTNATGLPTHRVAARLGVYSEWLEFVGYDQADGAVFPGVPLNMTLHWRALEPRRESFMLTARLRDRADREVAQSSGALFGTANRDGIVHVPWEIAVPVTATSGMYRLELNVDAGGVGRVPVLNKDRQPTSDKLFIGPFRISPVPPTQGELNNARRANAQFAGSFVLLGYSIPDQTARAGEKVSVIVYWMSLAGSDKDYTVFLHMLDSGGNLRAQFDAQPRGGTYPTSIWDVGEIVRDDYVLELPRDLAPGDYRIEIGLYEYPSLERLPVRDANGEDLGDHLILSEIVKVSP